MARPVLLDTDTITFGDLLSGANTYEVPSFQRDYSWREENWDDLWQDIELAIKDKNYRHYMGAIVVQPDTARAGNYIVIDGQQRLATLSVLAIAVVKRIRALADAGVDKKRNVERADLLSSDFLGKKDAASLTYSSKLSLNAVDDPIYQDYLMQFEDPPQEKGLPKSTKALLAAYRYFDSQVEDNRQIAADGKSLAAFLANTAASQLLFIRISVQDQLNAYTVFETLNARGVELSATDLLKNYLFSLMRTKVDLSRIERRWAAVVAIVRYEHFPELLRYYLSLTRSLVRRERVFKTLRDAVRNGRAAFDLLEDLKRYAELFVALGDPEHDFWDERPDATEHVRDLVLFRVRQLYPLIFAAYDKFSAENFVRLLRMLVVISFRYSVVSERNSNYLERAYNAAANGIMDGRITKPRGVFSLLRDQDIYVSDKEFASDFSAARWASAGTYKKLTRYVLYALENDVAGDHRDVEERGGTVEHILPENASNAWSKVTSDPDWDQYVGRIGNLTLLERKLNRQVGGKDFDIKRNAYKRSVYCLSKEVDEKEWSLAAIEARSEIMAKRAVKIWRVNFD